MAHDVPLRCAPDEYDDLISGTCSHLPQQYVFLAHVGDLPVNAGRELFELWQSNFIQYHAMNVYTITVLWES
nr:DUF2787 family protein [Escherichia coli]